MNLLQLLYFQEVAKYEHISKAADELHIAQPHLTRTIHSLEEELDVPLFARRGRGLVLTQYGRTWLKYVNRIFDTLEAGKEKLNAMKNQEKTTVLISFHSAAMLAPDIVYEITEAAPAIRITLTSHSSQSHLSIGCSWRKDGEKNQIQLLHEVLQIALPPEHSLESKAALTLEDINSLEFILPTPNNPIYDVIYHYLDVLSLNIKVTMHVQNPDLLCSLVKEKSCAAFIPKRPERYLR